ncbi:MAG: DUF3558 family protein [Mycobacterium sp.]
MAASRTTFVFVALTACLVLAGCGDDKPATPQPPQSSETPVPGSPINACTLVSPDDIAKLLGKPIEGRPIGAAPDAPACTWENRDTYESVTVEIGNPGTAVNGTLPPPGPGLPEMGTPAPDGMRFVASGMVDFPAAGRLNTVQVAVLKLLGPDADNAAVDLARKIGPQLPQ